MKSKYEPAQVLKSIRGINAGSKMDMDDLCTALSATRITFDDIIDSIWTFDKADEALQYLWQGK